MNKNSVREKNVINSHPYKISPSHRSPSLVKEPFFSLYSFSPSHVTTSSNDTSKLDSGHDITDMLLGKENDHTLDTESLIQEIQKRVWQALKKGYQYSPMVDQSDKFLRDHVFSRIDMVVLYVDLVNSTIMALELPEDKLAIIISSFAQEMAYIAKRYDGFVLKFVGDAVLIYFVAGKKAIQVADNAIECAKSMITMIRKGINPILNQYDYPDLMVKIGIDFGTNIVVRYGSDSEKSHVDLIGPSLNIASKIQGLAKPNQILIGDDVYELLHPSQQKNFHEIIWKSNQWKYRSRVTGNIYKVYEYKE